MTTALFAGFGAILLISSLMVILHKNPVASALFLVLSFCSLAGIYFLLQAEFLGMVQIIVYAGAIMVLFLFVIMYLNLGRDVEGGVQIVFRRAVGWLLGVVVLALGAMLLGRGWILGPAATSPIDPAVPNTQAIGQVLYTRYLFPFEVTSILLLVAMIGAVVVARGRLAHVEPSTSGRRVAPPPAPTAPGPDRSGAPATPASEPPAPAPEKIGAASGAAGDA